MLLPRIIPFLLLKDGSLVKTVNFDSPKYVGDPINAVRIFNEKEVDELAVIDIGATTSGRPPNFSLIGTLAAECRMPLCYGGGITTVQQIEQIISLGVEKVALGAAAAQNSDLLKNAIARIGGQSIVAVMDVKRNSAGIPEVYINNGKISVHNNPVEFAVNLQSIGVGEIIVNSIDQDGTLLGYDTDVLLKIRNAVNIPLTALGGAGSVKDIEVLFSKVGLVGAGAGSLFVFKGKYRAVLINYLNSNQRESLFSTFRLGQQ